MATETWAVGMVKDEADIAASTVGRMQAQVDHVLIADNGSTDGTREILEGLGVEVIEDPEPGYWQSRKMSALAEKARRGGAEWIVPFDADEVWLPRPGGRIADALAGLSGSVLVAEASLYDHVATAEDPDEGGPVERMGWRRQSPGSLPKVACRAVPGLVIHQGNHGASFPGNDLPATVTNLLTVRHFPYRSARQLVLKVRNGAAAYAATDLPETSGAHWRQYGAILEAHGERGIADLFHKWFWRERPGEPLVIDGEEQLPLVFDPCP